MLGLYSYELLLNLHFNSWNEGKTPGYIFSPQTMYSKIMNFPTIAGTKPPFVQKEFPAHSAAQYQAN